MIAHLRVSASLICAELASDGGIPPDIKCTAILRGFHGAQNSVAHSSVCKQCWSAVWSDNKARLECVMSTKEDDVLELVFWDESSIPPSCLGECFLQTEDLESFALSVARCTSLASPTVRTFSIVQKSDEQMVVVGNVVLDIKLQPPSLISTPQLPAPNSSRESVFVGPVGQNIDFFLKKSTPSNKSGAGRTTEMHFSKRGNLAFEGESFVKGLSNIQSNLQNRLVFEGMGQVSERAENGHISSLNGETTSDHSAASRAMHAVDFLNSVDGVMVNSKSLENAKELIAGSQGSTVTLALIPMMSDIHLHTSGLQSANISTIWPEGEVGSILSCTSVRAGQEHWLLHSNQSLEQKQRAGQWLHANQQGAASESLEGEKILAPLAGTESERLRSTDRDPSITDGAVLKQDITVVVDQNLFLSGELKQQDLPLSAVHHSPPDSTHLQLNLDMTDRAKLASKATAAADGAFSQIQATTKARKTSLLGKLEDSPRKDMLHESIDGGGDMQSQEAISVSPTNSYINRLNQAALPGNSGIFIPGISLSVENDCTPVAADADIKANLMDAPTPVLPNPERGSETPVRVAAGLQKSTALGGCSEGLLNARESETEILSVNENVMDVQETCLLRPSEEGLEAPSEQRNSPEYTDKGSNQALVHQPNPLKHDVTANQRRKPWLAFYFRIVALMLCTVSVALVLGSLDASPPWHILAWTSVVSLGISPWCKHPAFFFQGPITVSVRLWRHPGCMIGTAPSFPIWWVTISSFVSATFGNSIHSSALLGLKHGVAGGFAFAIWYIGVCVMGCAVCLVRIRWPHSRSILNCIDLCYGQTAASVFGCLCLYRLLNVVWMSTFAAGTLFAGYNDASSHFWGSLLVGLAPCIYCLAGGSQATVVTQTLQGIIAISLLICLITALPVTGTCWVCESSDGAWTEIGGLIFFRFLQGCFSLPWVSAVLTDRLFMGTPLRTLSAFLLGILFAFAYSFIGSFIGIYGKVFGIAQVPVDAVQALGDIYGYLFALMILLNVMAAIDSSMISTANLVGIELHSRLFPSKSPPQASVLGKGHLISAYIAILSLATGGICFLASYKGSQRVLPSPFLSSVMTMGLGPPCLLLAVWRKTWKQSPLSFILPVLTSLIIGIIHVASTNCIDNNFDICLNYSNTSMMNWKIGTGPYANELALSVFTLLFSIIACWAGFVVDHQFR